MGGHGGLNILPQKSWNVYGRENRLKVARDEARAAAEEAATHQQHVAAERDYRHQLLLKRASRRQQLEQGSSIAPPDGIEELSRLAKDPHLLSVPGHRVGQGAQAESAGTPPQQCHGASDGPAELHHINFWAEEEARREHPERQQEQREQLRRRGKVETQTLDPRFDEQFQLGYRMSGPQPWYTQVPTYKGAEPQLGVADDKIAAAGVSVMHNTVEEQLQAELGRWLPEVKRRMRHEGAAHGTRDLGISAQSCGTLSSTGSSTSYDSDSRKELGRRARSKDSKQHSAHNPPPASKYHRHKDKQRDKGKHKQSRERKRGRDKQEHSSKKRQKKLEQQLGVLLGTRKSTEELRAERIRREEEERLRAKQLLQGAAPTGFQSGYGYANKLRELKSAEAGAAAAATSAAIAAHALGPPPNMMR